MKNKRRKTITAGIALALIVSLLAGCAAIQASGSSASDQPAASANTSPETSLSQGSQLTYVSIDINPSIQLTIENGIVIEAKAYNDDGGQILSEYNVVSMDSASAMGTLVNAFSSQGYIVKDDPSASLVITVTGIQDQQLLDSLKESAKQNLDTLGLQCQIVATMVSQQIIQDAQNSSLSPGRYILLKQIALQENISIEEAKVKYGSLKMSELLKLIDNVDEFLNETQQVNTILESLTPEQLLILTQAQSAYEAAMKAVQQAFLEARKEAKDNFTIARDQVKEAFLADKDTDKLKTSKIEVKVAFSKAKQDALAVMKLAKTQARTAFMAAIASLGLDEATIEKLLDWDFNTEFDVDMNFGFGNEQNTGNENKENGNNGNGHGNSQNNGKHNGNQQNGNKNQNTNKD